MHLSSPLRKARSTVTEGSGEPLVLPKSRVYFQNCQHETFASSNMKCNELVTNMSNSWNECTEFCSGLKCSVAHSVPGAGTAQWCVPDNSTYSTSCATWAPVFRCQPRGSSNRFQMWEDSQIVNFIFAPPSAAAAFVRRWAHALTLSSVDPWGDPGVGTNSLRFTEIHWAQREQAEHGNALPDSNASVIICRMFRTSRVALNPSWPEGSSAQPGVASPIVSCGCGKPRTVIAWIRIPSCLPMADATSPWSDLTVWKHVVQFQAGHRLSRLQ